MSYSTNEQHNMVPYCIELPEKYSLKEEKEPIRIFLSCKSKRRITHICHSAMRFILITTVFTVIFLFGYFVVLWCSDYNKNDNNKSSKNDIIITDGAEITYEDTCNEDIPVSVIVRENELNLIDESRTGINILDYIDEDYMLHSIMSNDKDIKVIIIHSHTSEYVSENLSVLDAGEVLTQLLNSAGVNTFHCVTLHDDSGRIGAYNNMEKSINYLIQEHTQSVLIVDLHNSDITDQITFTVGTDSGFAWKENFRLAVALSEEMCDYNRSIRLLPNTLGQNNGLLTVNVGIGSELYADEDARSLISSLFSGIFNLCKANPSE